MTIKLGLLILFCCLALCIIARVDGEEAAGSKTKGGPAGGVDDGDGSSATASSYLDRIKAAAGWAQSYFVPPGHNYFIGGATTKAADKIIDGGEEGGGGGGERVKEAVTRSIEKGKETIENTAKSAARMATKTAHEAKEKVKTTISDSKTAQVKISDYEDDDEL